MQANIHIHIYLKPKYNNNDIIICFGSIETVVLGGTQQKGDYNEKACPFDAKYIYDGCVALVSALKHSQVVEEWAGLRPSRKAVRLECDQFVTGFV